MNTNTQKTQHTPTPERGSAAILIELHNSQITIRHGDTNEELTSPRNVTKGFWDELFWLLENPQAVMQARAALAAAKGEDV